MVDVRKSPADRLILILLPASGMEPTGRAESFEAAAALTPVQRRGPLGGVKVMTRLTRNRGFLSYRWIAKVDCWR
jgi:hypothetical protein